MTDTYEQLNQEKLVKLQKDAHEDSINITDKRMYHEMTGDTGSHDFMLEKLDQQFSVLGEIRKTGRPAHLEEVQKEEPRYQHIGHFDKKARKSAAKEAQHLTQKAKDLNKKMQDLPASTRTITYDLKMTELMRQAETESLKANGIAEGSIEFDRMNLKYLRHSEIIMENTLQDKTMSEEQYKAVSDSLLNVQSKIDEVLEHDNVRDLQEFNFIEVAAREANKPTLDPEEGEAVLRRTAKVAECIPVDLHRLSVISPKLFRVDEKQIEKFAKQREKEEKEKDDGEVSDFKAYIKKHDLNKVDEKENQYTEPIDKMLAYLDAHKEELGGSPHFDGERPYLVKSTKKIFGYPWSVFREWIDTHSRKKLSKKESEAEIEKKQVKVATRARSKALDMKQRVHNRIKRNLDNLLDLADEYELLGKELTEDMKAARNFQEIDPNAENIYDLYEIPPLETFMPDREEIELNLPKGYNAFQRAGVKVIRALTGVAMEDYKAKKAEKKKERAKKKAEEKEREDLFKAILAGEVNMDDDAADEPVQQEVAEKKKTKFVGKTLYEEAYAFLLNFRAIASRFDEVEKVFDKFQQSYLTEDNKHNKTVEKCMEDYVRQVSDLVLHSDSNSPKTLIGSLKDIFSMIGTMADNSKELNDVKEMATYLSGACLGARMASISKYYSQSNYTLRKDEAAETVEVKATAAETVEVKAAAEETVEVKKEQKLGEDEPLQEGCRYFEQVHREFTDLPEKGWLTAASILVGFLIDDAAAMDDFTHLDGGYLRWPHFEELLPMLRHEMLGKSFNMMNELDEVMYDENNYPVRVIVTEEMLTSMQLRKYLSIGCKLYDKDAWKLLKNRRVKPVDMWAETRKDALMFKPVDDGLTNEEYLEENYDTAYDPNTFKTPAQLKQEEKKGDAPSDTEGN